MPLTYNLLDNQRAERKLMQTYVNVGTSSAKDWELVGMFVEDSTLELNPSETTITDILGITRTSIDTMEPAQTLDGAVVGGSKLQQKLFDIYSRKAYSEFAMFETMLVLGFIGQTSDYYAEAHQNCTIMLNSFGGSSYVDMSFEIRLSGDKVIGTVDKLNPGLVFTPGTGTI